MHILKLLVSHLQADCGQVPDQAAQPGEVGQQSAILGDFHGAFKAVLGLRSSAGNTAVDEARIWGRQSCLEYLGRLEHRCKRGLPSELEMESKH